MTLKEELATLRRQIGEERDARERQPVQRAPRRACRTSDQRKDQKFPKPKE